MFVSDNAKVNAAGHLAFSGADTVALAQKYGTPLYVTSLDGVKASCAEFTAALQKHYGGRGMILFASKANCNKAVCKTVSSCGFGLDVVSGGELYTALKANVNPEKICFHGNNKTETELRLAIESGVGRIFSDSMSELDDIERIAAELGKKVKVLVRANPGVEASTHEYIMTGQVDSKFGLSIEKGDALAGVLKALASEHIELAGIDCHIGSQIFEVLPFEDEAEMLMRFLVNIRELTGVTLPELNIGGGFGVRYVPSDDPLSADRIIGAVAARVKRFCAENGFPEPFLKFEPGRAIVANNGITLYTVGCVKEIEGVRNYVSVDGGMFDNPRYALYKARYTACVANKASFPSDYHAAIAGKCCESGDLIGRDIEIQRPERGDILAVFTTGAYNYSMSSNYNRNPRPAMVVIENGEDRLAIRRETYADLTAFDEE